MKPLIALALLPLFAGGEPKSYPLLVRIKKMDTTITTRGTFVGYRKGHGMANVVEAGKPIQGIDFEFDGCDRFDATGAPGGYPARWKNDHTLYIQLEEIGSDKTKECELKVNLKPFMYYKGKEGKLTTKPLGQPVKELKTED